MMSDTSRSIYDVIIVGGGASGSALLYTLARYTDIRNTALVEKYGAPGQVNSKATNNSQTLHVGDIETNYSIEKVQQVYPAAMMIAEYAQTLPKEKRETFLYPTSKMVLAVGTHEVAALEERFKALRSIFPDLELLDAEGITHVEPAVTQGRSPKIPIRALYTQHGYAVDFEKLSSQFINHAQTLRPDIDVLLLHEVVRIERDNHGIYVLHIKNGTILRAKTLVVNADSYSLLLAQQLGYGKEFSLIPIAGSFYFSRPLLNGKVYTMQDPKLPFAAVHGDPDIRSPHNETRWGPTARFYPVLEARNTRTFVDFVRSSGFERLATWFSFAKILLDPTRLTYLLENMLYELPWIGKLMFIKNVRKIVPTLRAEDVRYAKGYGGMRLQRVNTHTKDLLLGEGKIVGEHVLFNMTPSPGASVALYNAMRDAETVVQFLGADTQFDKETMLAELYHEPTQHSQEMLHTSSAFPDVSQNDTYTA